MEKDFHYDVIYAVAKLTEIESAEIIAYASQYVDDNSDEQFLIDGGSEFPEKLRMNDGCYYPVMTQCRIPEGMNLFVQKHVFVPFHFLPGDNHVVIQGRKNPFTVTPNSKNARFILSNALQMNNPYLIGIALHTLGDSWSHQNFTGLREDWNSLERRDDLPGSLLPNIGHGDAGKTPDIISESWIDARFGNERINNRERALEASREIFTHFQKKSNRGPSWQDVENDLQEIMDAKDSADRENRVKNFLKDNGDGTIPEYSRYSWINEAIDRSGAQMAVAPDFTRTHWYHFQQAAKAHLALVVDLIKGLQPALMPGTEGLTFSWIVGCWCLGFGT